MYKNLLHLPLPLPLMSLSKNDMAINDFLDNSLILCDNNFVAALEVVEPALDILTTGMIHSSLKNHLRPHLSTRLVFDVQQQQQQQLLITR